MSDGPVHGSFGLTYASFLVWPRAAMEAMPIDWQTRFVALAKEFNDTFTGYEPPGGYTVMGKDERNRFVRPPFTNYRHPDQAAIEACRRKETTP